MMLSISAAAALAFQCAPGVAPETLLSVAHAESELDTLAIGVNRGPSPRRRAGTEAEAARIARSLIAQGYSVDLGIAQINNRNLGWLGLSVEDAFDVCKNFAAAARVLGDAYAATLRAGGDDPLGRAFSRYNSGNDRRGFANGYVGRVYRAARRIMPALRAPGEPPVPGEAPPRPDSMPARGLSAGAIEPEPRAEHPAPDWDVFARAPVSPLIVFGDPQ